MLALTNGPTKRPRGKRGGRKLREKREVSPDASCSTAVKFSCNPDVSVPQR